MSNYLIGLDVWEGNLGEIDEALLKQEGVKYIITRLNSMNGGHRLDRSFYKQWEESAGFVRWPYAAGEVITSTVPAALTFAGVGRVSGGTGLLVDALLIDSANQATKPSLELWLFSTAPAMDNDNAVFTPTDAELAALLGIIQFQTAFVGDATAGAGGNSVIPSERTYLPVYLKCASTVTAIYGVLVTRSAYTPVSGEIFTVILKVVQD